MDSRSLWAAHAAGDTDARDALLCEQISLVHHVARQLARGLTTEANIDELVSAGTMGLMAALTSFDQTRGLAFSTFAVPRIRGAILDELRRQDHVPRSVRRKTRDIAAARDAVGGAIGRAPDTTAVARALGVDAETLWRWQADVEGLKAREIAEVLGVSESRVSQIRSRALSQLRGAFSPLQAAS